MLSVQVQNLQGLQMQGAGAGQPHILGGGTLQALGITPQGNVIASPLQGAPLSPLQTVQAALANGQLLGQCHSPSFPLSLEGETLTISTRCIRGGKLETN